MQVLTIKNIAPFQSNQFTDTQADKNGNCIFSSNLDRNKPLFGLVETCFDGMNYKDVRDPVILEMKRISNMLSHWLETQSLYIKSL